MAAAILIIECPVCKKTVTQTFDDLNEFIKKGTWDYVTGIKYFNFSRVASDKYLACPDCRQRYDSLIASQAEERKNFK